MKSQIYSLFLTKAKNIFAVMNLFIFLFVTLLNFAVVMPAAFAVGPTVWDTDGVDYTEFNFEITDADWISGWSEYNMMVAFCYGTEFDCDPPGAVYISPGGSNTVTAYVPPSEGKTKVMASLYWWSDGDSESGEPAYYQDVSANPFTLGSGPYTVNFDDIIAFDNPYVGGGELAVNFAEISDATEKMVRVVFETATLDSATATNASNYTLTTSNGDINPDTAVVDGGMVNEVILDFTTALSNVSVERIVAGSSGFNLSVVGVMDNAQANTSSDTTVIINAMENMFGGFFGPPVVVNEVNSDPKRDWSSDSFVYDSGSLPAETPTKTVGVENDQYIELRINRILDDMPDITTAGEIDLSKIRIEVRNDDDQLILSCDLAAGPSCSNDAPKFQTVTYVGAGNFGAPGRGEFLILSNPSVALPQDNMAVALKAQGESNFFMMDVMFGEMYGQSEYNAPYLNNNGASRTLSQESVGLDDKGNFMGAWNTAYGYQASTPGADNSYTTPFGVMGAFPCGTSQVCMDFNKPVAMASLSGNISVYEGGTTDPATCEGGACTVGSVVIEGGDGRFVKVFLSSNMLDGQPYDLFIAGGAGGVLSTGDDQLAAEGVYRGFGGYAMDDTPPAIVDVVVQNEKAIRVMFDENNGLDTSAMDNNSFGFSPSLTIDSWWPDWESINVELTGSMTPDVNYTLTIDDLKDSMGNVLSSNNVAYFDGFNASGFDNNEPPKITGSYPYDGDTGVPTNLGAISINFSEELHTSTVDSVNFGLTEWNEDSNTAGAVYNFDAVSFDRNTNTVFLGLNELAPLTANTWYEYTVIGSSGGIMDLSGSFLPSTRKFHFLTAGAADTTRPIVEGTSLSEFEGAVPVGMPPIEIYFSKMAMNLSTVESTTMNENTNIYVTTNSSGGTDYLNGRVEYKDGVARVVIDELLNPDTTYTLTVTTDVQDNSGNGLAAQFSQQFTTGDLDATGASIGFANSNGTNMWIGFTEPMKESTVVNLSNYTFTFDGTAVSGAELSGLNAMYRPEWNEVEIFPFNGYAAGTEYAVTVNANLKDLAGNVIPAEGRTKTGEVFDEMAMMNSPNVWEHSPMHDEWGVPINIKVLFGLFSKDLDASSVDTDSLGLYLDSNPASNLCNNINYLSASRIVTCRLTSALSANTRYNFKIGSDESANTIKDTEGNNFPFPFMAHFETSGDSDVVAPTVPWSEPANLATDVSVGAGRISVGFSEDMDPATFTSTTLQVYLTADDTSKVAGTREYHPFGRVVDFFPNDPLTANTSYTVKLTTGAKDRQGTAMAGDYTFAFTTGGEDNTTPELRGAHVTNKDICMNFSEPLNESIALTKANYTLKVSEAAGGEASNTVNLDNAQIDYHPFPEGSEVCMFGFNLDSGVNWSLTVRNVKDVVGNTIATGDNTASGQIMNMFFMDKAPEVMFSYPGPGMHDIPINIPKVEVGFSEPIDPSTLTSDTFKLYPHTCDSTGCSQGSEVVVASYGYDNATQSAYLGLDGNLTADTEYQIVVTTGITDSSGNGLRSFDMFNKTGNSYAYDSSFHTSASGQADTSAPEVWGSSLQEFMDSSGNIVNVPPQLWGIDVPFSKQMDTNTVIDLNAADAGSKIYVEKDAGNVKVQGHSEYDFQGRRAIWYPDGVLESNTAYTFYVTTGVTDNMGNALGQTYSQAFTTSNIAADTKGPFIVGAEADEYGITLWFNEPVNKQAAENWRNYTVQTTTDLAGGVFSNINIEEAEINYRPMDRAVDIDKITLTKDDIVLFTASTKITDLANNAMVSSQDDPLGVDAAVDNDFNAPRSLDGTNNNFNQYEFYVNEYYDSYYEADDMTDSQKLINKFGGARVEPENRLAGASTALFVDVPLFVSVPAGGTISLKLPSKFNIASAGTMPVWTPGGSGMMSPVNGDINGPGTGTVTIASINTNTATNTINIVTAGAATQATDFITYDLTGIINPSTTSAEGYMAEITTYGTDGKKLEGPINTDSIPIDKNGTAKINITVEVNGLGEGVFVDNGEMVRVHLNNKDGAHFETETSAFTGDSNTTTATFRNLPAGKYFANFEPFMKLAVDSSDSEFYNETEYMEVFLADGQTSNVTMSIASATAATFNGITMRDLTVTATGGPASEKVDININNWDRNFTFEDAFDGSGNLSSTFKVPDGFYNVSVDPWMPKGFFKGPPPQMSFMPAPPRGIDVDGTDDSIAFTLKSATNYAKVIVQKAGGDAIVNANVFFDPLNKDSFGGGIGGDTGQDGSITRAMPAGSYQVHVHVPGIPFIKPQSIEVTSANDAQNPETLTITTTVPDIEISGKVTKNGQAISYTPVFANLIDENGDFLPEHMDTMTDSNGEYSIFVDASTSWNLGAWFHEYGEVSKTLTVGTSDLSSQDLSLNTNNYVTVTGTLQYGQGDTALGYSFVDAQSTVEGSHYFNGTQTNAQGEFTLSLPASPGEYRLSTFHPDFGMMTFKSDLDITDGEDDALGTISVSAGDTGEVTVRFIDGQGDPYVVNEAFIDFMSDTTGSGNHMQMREVSEMQMRVVEGSGYEVHGFVPEFGPLPEQTGLSLEEGSIVTFTLGSSVTISGSITDGAEGLADAKIKLFSADPSSPFERVTMTDENGDYSMDVLPSKTYFVKVIKNGYLPLREDLAVSAVNMANQDYEMEAENQELTISGTVKFGGTAITSNAKVVAREALGKDKVVHLDADDAGVFSINVSPGIWTLKAYSEGMNTISANEQEVTITASAVSGVNITLTAMEGDYNTKGSSYSITPADGGVIVHENPPLTITVPAGALGSGRQSYSMSVRQTTAVVETSSASPAMDFGFDITVTDNNGQNVTQLEDYIVIEQDLTDSGLTAEQFGLIQCASISEVDDADWESVMCVKNLENMTITYSTNHFSVFGPVSWTDAVAPSAPTGLQASAGNAEVVLDWSDNGEADFLEYEVYRATSAGFTPAAGNQLNSAQLTVSTYTDSTAQNATTYYYKVSAVDGSGNESGFSSVSATPVAPAAPGGGSPGGGGSSGSPRTVTFGEVDEENPAVTEEADLEVYAVSGTAITGAFSVSAEKVVVEEVSVENADLGVMLTLPAGTAIVTDAEITAVEVVAEEEEVVEEVVEGEEVIVDEETIVEEVVVEPEYTYTFEIPIALASGDVPAIPDTFSVVGNVIEIGGAEPISFSEEITLTFPVRDDLESGFAYYYDEEEAEWMILGDGGEIMALEDGSHVLVVETDHLTLFAVLEMDTTTPFIDIIGHWSQEYIEDLYDQEIVGGKDANHYDPEGFTTRAEFTKIALNAFGIEVPEELEEVFSDVDVEEWYAGFVQAAYEGEIVGGYDDGTFKPDKTINRSEAVKVLLETAGLTVETEFDAGFEDVDADEWYTDYVNYAAENGIVGGYEDGTFGPDNGLRRGEVAKIVSILLDNVADLLAE